jgi:hypothetical protein
VNENASLIDDSRTRCLCDVGRDDYIAATAIAADGTEHLVLAELDSLGDETVRYDPGCGDVAHEQLGALPPRWAARTTLAPLRCGRRTQAGHPCRILVTRPGDTCTWHRTPTTERNHR